MNQPEPLEQNTTTPEQDRDQWLAERRKRIGASDVSAILGLNPYRTAHEVWLDKTNRIEPFAGNAATREGVRFEPLILDAAERELGTLERNVVVPATGLDFPMAATLDGRLLASGAPVEAKTSGIVGPVWGTWGDADTDEVPQPYLVQVVAEMICTESDIGHLFALLGGRGVVRYRVLRDEAVAKWLTELLGKWWRTHIDGGVEPALSEPMPLDVVKRLRRTPDKTVAFDEAGMEAVAAWEARNDAKKQADKAVKAAQSAMLQLLGDAEGAELPDGRVLTYLSQTASGYTVGEKTYRVARIKKG
jgi:putative phage-type endonuclease